VTGEILEVVGVRKHVTFMHAYPDYVPLPAAAGGSQKPQQTFTGATARYVV